jgi:hypothetical protein
MDHLNYQPQLRPSPANLLTRAGWIRGTFRIPPHQSLIDFLTTSVNILKFTTLTISGDETEYAFAGLRPDAVSLIEPVLGDELVLSPGAGHITSPRSVICLLDAGTLSGTVDALVNVRISDYLRAAPEYMLIRDSVFVPRGETTASPNCRRMRTALVHVPVVIGVAEREGHGNP